MKALVFDCDGVLAETERDGHRVAFNRAFAATGLPLEWSVEDYAVLLHTAGGKERIRAALHPDLVREHGLVKDTSALDDLVAAVHAEKTRIFLTMVADGLMPPRPGVRRLALAAAQDGWRIGVASTSAVASVDAIARRSLGEDIVGDCVLVAGDMVGAKKPAPDVYLEALRRLGVDSSAAVAVEDSEIGVRAAHSAGVATVATVSHYTADEDLGLARVVVDSLGEPGSGPLHVRNNATTVAIEDHIGVHHLAACLDGSPQGA